MSSPPARTYYWDFFGPRSGPTAAHFKRHLESFLVEHGVPGAAAAEAAPEPFHHTVGVSVPSEHWQLIERALRPKRHS